MRDSYLIVGVGGLLALAVIAQLLLTMGWAGALTFGGIVVCAWIIHRLAA